MNLFQWGNFKSHAGLDLAFKIDCDALTDEDWECAAKIVASRLKFGKVIGIPRGGIKFAEALEPYITPGHNMTLIVDDVVTTGSSMLEEIKKLPGLGPVRCICLFCRSSNPFVYVWPIFQLGSWLCQKN